jgi:hypothetical protein
MWLEPRCFAPLVVAVAAAASTALPPIAAADPFGPVYGGGGADAVINDLKDQGYNVMINWTTGYDTKPLDQCWVTQINNPGNQAPSPDTFTTVYVDVACSNHDDDSGFRGGISIGIG